MSTAARACWRCSPSRATSQTAGMPSVTATLAIETGQKVLRLALAQRLTRLLGGKLALIVALLVAGVSFGIRRRPRAEPPVRRPGVRGGGSGPGRCRRVLPRPGQGESLRVGDPAVHRAGSRSRRQRHVSVRAQHRACRPAMSLPDRRRRCVPSPRGSSVRSRFAICPTRRKPTTWRHAARARRHRRLARLASVSADS